MPEPELPVLLFSAKDAVCEQRLGAAPALPPVVVSRQPSVLALNRRFPGCATAPIHASAGRAPSILSPYESVDVLPSGRVKNWPRNTFAQHTCVYAPARAFSPTRTCKADRVRRC